MFALQDWKTVPFKTFGDEAAGIAGGVAPAANGLALTQSATNVVDRVLSVTSTMNLRQSEWFVEGASSTMNMTDAATWGNERPVSVNSNMAMSSGVAVSGGQHLGSEIIEGVADSPILAGWVLYIKNTGNADPAQADAAATADAVGVAVAAGGGITPAPVYYRTYGLVELSDWTGAAGAATLTPGAVYYLSAATAGMITSTAPTGDGDIVVKIGIAITTTTLNIEIGEGVAL